MTVRRLGFAVLILGTSSLRLPPAGAAPASSYWLEAAPQDSAEAELRDALAKAAFATPAAGAASLRQVSEAHPGTVVSGLAQLAAGLLTLERGRAADAPAFLRHPDIAKTSLADYALLALAQGLEAARDPSAAEIYVAAAEARPEGPVACVAFFRAADALAGSARQTEAVAVLTRATTACPQQQPRALLQIAELRDAQRELKAAAEAYDRLDREFPVSPQAKEAAARLRALASYLPAASADARNARDLRKAIALADADDTTRSIPLLRALLTRRLGREDADLVHLRLGRALLSTKREREGEAQLAAVSDDSPWGAEAAFQRAKVAARRIQRGDPFEAVATRYAGTPWGEEALLSLANFYQKDARDDDALPYYRRLLDGYPQGRYAERAAWRVAWGTYRQGRFDEAAQSLERAARLMPTSPYTPGMLYWAARARLTLGDTERARQLLAETVQRFKNGYHGLLAQQALKRLPAGATAAPALVLRSSSLAPADGIPEPQLTRLRQLLLLDRVDAAFDELKALPPTPASQATIASLESRRGRLRPAITAMKRAYPEYVSQAGDELPDSVWRIIYPLAFGEMLTAKAAEEGLDPALVAGLICQESTFDANAVSVAGARGLMQVMPRTGRTIARAKRVGYSTRALHDPAVAMDFGTHYLRHLMDRFGGRVERVLAAYNAGPERVDAWTASQPDMPAEEFVERIPFTETRIYVMTVLNAREQYRRIYSLAQPAQTATVGGDARP